jgi:putative PEP-CTERM system TPR-repeat lipoprotein
MSAGEYRMAVASFTRFADMLPKAPQPLMMLASAQMAARQPDDAVRSLRNALALKPDLTVAQRDLASIYVAMGKSDDALKQARTLQAERPKQAFGYVLEGEIHAAQRDWESAEQVYREATKRFDLPVLVSRTHQVMLAAGKNDQAEALAENWIKSHPKDAFMLNYLAERDLGAQRYESAAKRYSAALRRAPDNVRMLNNLAWVTHQLGQPAALQYAERAYELAADDPQVMDTLGSILMARGETERGLELLGRASALAPQAHEMRLNFAKALLKANRKDPARKELEALAKLDKRNPVQQEAVTLLGTP